MAGMWTMMTTLTLLGLSLVTATIPSPTRLVPTVQIQLQCVSLYPMTRSGYVDLNATRRLLVAQAVHQAFDALHPTIPLLQVTPAPSELPPPGSATTLYYPPWFVVSGTWPARVTDLGSYRGVYNEPGERELAPPTALEAVYMAQLRAVGVMVNRCLVNEVVAWSVAESSVPNPTKAPVKRTTKAPVKRTTKAPVKRTTKAPVKRTTKAPTKNPTKAPVKRPIKAPVMVPTPVPPTAMKPRTMEILVTCNGLSTLSSAGTSTLPAQSAARAVTQAYQTVFAVPLTHANLTGTLATPLSWMPPSSTTLVFRAHITTNDYLTIHPTYSAVRALYPTWATQFATNLVATHLGTLANVQTCRLESMALVRPPNVQGTYA